AFEGRNLNLGPRPALVGGFVDHGRLGFGLSAAVAGTETEAARALRGGQHDIGIVVGVLQVARAIVICGLQNVVPALAAIAGAIDTSAMVGGIAKRGDEDDVGVGRIDKNAVDLHSVLEADVLPGPAGIGGLPHAIAEAAADGVASAGINDIGIGGSDLDGADAIDARLLIEDGKPHHAGTGSFPDAAQGRADVEHSGAAADTGHGRDASAVEWTDVTPLEACIEVRVDLRGRAQG